MPTPKFIAVLCAGFLVLGSGTRDMVAPMDVQYPLFLKILTFDRKLDRRAGKEIVIGIIYQERVRASWLAKDEFLDAMENSPIKRIKDIPVRAVPIALDDGGTIEEELVGEAIDVLYVTPLRAHDIRKITRLSQARRLLTLTGVPEYVDAGLSVGIGISGDTPEILVNLESAKKEGADLHASLLRLARLVGGV